jgi:hypothetical protein
MPLFRKRPFVVEAEHFDGSVESANRVLAWIGKRGGAAKRLHGINPSRGLILSTHTGDVIVVPGDWVVRDSAGGFAPCKPGTFTATYEAA